MAETALMILLNQLADTLINEDCLFTCGLGKEIEEIKADLEMLRAVLMEADRCQRDGDHVMAVWVRQVRELAYDMEDVIDRFPVRMQEPCFLFFKHLIARRQIATKIKEIKLRIKSICERKTNLSLSDINPSTSSASGEAQPDARLVDPLLVNESELVGIHRPRDRLIKQLVEGESGLAIIPVVGMAGLGKTTLIRKVYENQRVHEHFPCYAWITVSKSFQVDELLRRMAIQYFETSKESIPESIKFMNYVELVQMVSSSLLKKRYVCFIDDVWTIDDWTKIRHAFPDNLCGSRIILTTRNLDVAYFCDKSRKNLCRMEALSPDDSCALFCRRTFGSEGFESCPALEQPSRVILKVCKGLPLAINAIGGLLSTKNKSPLEWNRAHHSLGADLENGEGLNSMNKMISLSYDDLPHHLKPCFLYFGVFPEDHIISRTTLTYKWIAEGLIKPDSGLTSEEIAESYLNELIRRSLIQVTVWSADGYGRVLWCQVHDLMHELVVLKSKEQNFITVGRNTSQLDSQTRRLSIHNGQFLPRDVPSSKLRSLIIFKQCNVPLLSRFKMLKVLSVQYAPLDNFPVAITKLVYLRYLSLRGTNVKVVPNSIGKLKRLETLDLKCTLVTELPLGILKLPKIRHIVAAGVHPGSHNANVAVTAPTRIGRLTSLQKLCKIRLNGEEQVRELGKLTQLVKLTVAGIRRRDIEAMRESLNNMEHLQSLGLSSAEKTELVDFQPFFTKPPQLMSLRFLGSLDGTPETSGLLKNIGKIKLTYASNSHLNVLQGLPNLVDVQLARCYEEENLCCREGFPKLKVLELTDLPSLLLVTIEKGAMSNLERLTLASCGLLQKFPAGMEHLSTIKVIRLCRMPKELLHRIRIGGEDWDNVKHVPDVILQ